MSPAIILHALTEIAAKQIAVIKRENDGILALRTGGEKKRKALAQQEGAAQYEETAETQTPFYGDNR